MQRRKFKKIEIGFLIVRSSVVLLSFQHGVPGPGPEYAEEAGAAHQSSDACKIDRGFKRGSMSK